MKVLTKDGKILDVYGTQIGMKNSPFSQPTPEILFIVWDPSMREGGGWEMIPSSLCVPYEDEIHIEGSHPEFYPEIFNEDGSVKGVCEEIADDQEEQHQQGFSETHFEEEYS
jgi:hypothetical protein